MRTTIRPPKEPIPLSDIDLKDPASFDWWTDVSIRFSDQDPNLHVNNTAFAVYAEAGRVDYLNAIRRHLGIEPRSALASVQISYVNQLHYPGTVRVGTRLQRLGNKSYTLGQGLFSGETVVATSEAVLVFFDYERNGSREVPVELRRAFEAGAPLVAS
ncbi:MAG: acyl-CoA thioesterase [Rhodospirillales bacterium CG15_BIG_FIL_POST_REV_8_21_14_020_66_15]|nr:MAG: acyl-CoA thioesterase [Rhodospirillales bacterium CG15_BIG_FIL_POST_REV_8_21_14_020_66_15]